MHSTRRIPFADLLSGKAVTLSPRAIPLAFLQLAMLLAATLPIHAADNTPAQTVRAIKQRVAPQYPEIAKRMRVSGSVKVEATVKADGTVSATKTVAGNRLLSGAAEDAVQKWKFVPAAEESRVEVDVNFALAP